MLVITGPNGNVGTELVKAVMKKGKLPYRIASRNPEEIRQQFGTDANCVHFDFGDRDTWQATLAGADTVFLLFPLPHPKTARTWMVPFVEACAQAEVKHIVYVSVPGAHRLRVVPHHAVETAIRASGIPYTVLQAAFFSQNLCRDITTHAVDIAVHNEIYIPAGDGETSFIDSRDVAEVALHILMEPTAHRDRTYTLTGPERLTFHKVAKLFTEELGRPIRYAKPGLLAFRRRLKRRGVTWDTLFFMLIVYSLTRFDRNAPMTDTVEQLLGRPARSMRQFIADYREKWAPAASEAEATRIVKTPGLGLG